MLVVALSTLFGVSLGPISSSYIKASYAPSMQHGMSLYIESKNLPESYQMDLGDLSINWTGINMGFGINLANGLRLGILTEIYGNTEFAESIFFHSIDNTLLGVEIGYDFVFDKIVPFVDFSIGANQTTIHFGQDQETKGWGLALQGGIGIGYTVRKNIEPYLSYAFKLKTKQEIEHNESNTRHGIDEEYKYSENYGTIFSTTTRYIASSNYARSVDYHIGFTQYTTSIVEIGIKFIF
ncbi:MAG: hypothetical protein P857_582 [Candidatus Xenolissoclinum pacificiensis L6]|uniref:Outer membrane protein beta-barrel domain-containing protein n=1 Tax=Candidatus Xenolissoclinum pacificiensis L6 TaxID=1401685 RepID=W2UY95_9RICK|nr:MAG: hypothetical protein P857_582 [Candidatus Xenolissoclinum pacificiensis L6]